MVSLPPATRPTAWRTGPCPVALPGGQQNTMATAVHERGVRRNIPGRYHFDAITVNPVPISLSIAFDSSNSMKTTKLNIAVVPTGRPVTVRSIALAASVVVFSVACRPTSAQEYLSGIEWQKPPVVDPGPSDDAPPSDAVVLFGGQDDGTFEGIEGWTIENGELISGKGTITTKQNFGDCQVHLEWSAPNPPKGQGQHRGNSGLFFMGTYEMQILDSYQSETYHDGQAAAIYKQTPPMANAMRPPGQWNTYDVIWTCPKFNEDGSLQSPAYITAIHNGVVVLNHYELQGDTPYTRPPEYNPHPPTGPIALQDHNNPVRFRNFWVREIKQPEGTRTMPPSKRQGDKIVPIADLTE